MKMKATFSLKHTQIKDLPKTKSVQILESKILDLNDLVGGFEAFLKASGFVFDSLHVVRKDYRDE